MTDDAFGDGRASKLTFLIYLNGSCGGGGGDDDGASFSGGSTTFFRSGEPSGAESEGFVRVVEARAVAPATGVRPTACRVTTSRDLLRRGRAVFPARRRCRQPRA